MSVIIEGNIKIEYEPHVVAVITNSDGDCVAIGAGEGVYGSAYREAVQAADNHIYSGNYLGEDEELGYYPATRALVRKVQENGVYYDPKKRGLKYTL